VTERDGALTRRLARDVDGAFPDLVRWTQDRLYSGLRSMSRNAADAEDAAQETLLRAYRALAGYEPGRIERLDLSAWMWTIALNVVRNRARTASRRVREAELTGETHPGPSAEDEASLESAEWRARLGALPDDQRVAVVLRHVVDLPYAAIAAATGRPVGTVKSDVSRGIEALRRTMQQEVATR
jgi:RNA polymerase sigma-70 factor, ECF subfamily